MADFAHIAVHSTPLGPAWSAWSEQGLVRFSFEAIGLGGLSGHHGVDLRGESRELERLLKRYFRLGRESFAAVRVDLSHATAFTTRVYRACRAIEPGRTKTYGELAGIVGSAGASRAVGSAMARNRIPIIIPCHRVVGASGRLCGFSAPGGLETKRTLLDLEKQSPVQPTT